MIVNFYLNRIYFTSIGIFLGTQIINMKLSAADQQLQIVVHFLRQQIYMPLQIYLYLAYNFVYDEQYHMLLSCWKRLAPSRFRLANRFRIAAQWFMNEEGV